MQQYSGEIPIIVVYKDKLLMEQFGKMIDERNEQNKQAGSGPQIQLIRWTKKVWDQNSVAGNHTCKILFLGTNSIHDGLPQIMNVHYHGDGIAYGWTGQRAAVVANPDKLFAREDYVEFLSRFVQLPVAIPNVLRQDGLQAALDLQANLERNGFQGDLGELITAALLSICLDAPIVRAGGKNQYIGDLKRRQQLFYGVVEFANKALDKFLWDPLAQTKSVSATSETAGDNSGLYGVLNPQ